MDENASIIRCANCGLRLPLVLDENAEEDVIEWVCIKCGKIILGVFDTNAPFELWGNVRRTDTPPLS
jgi:DNA-directed RNA polymerase subunit RPC12/RpoP